MPGKVFISCGQRHRDERETADKIATLLLDEFGLQSYLAFNIQSLDDIMKITQELRSSDYYLFVDFLLIYYWEKPAEVLYMLWVFRKGRQDDLTPRQCKLLRELVKEYLA